MNFVPTLFVALLIAAAAPSPSPSPSASGAPNASVDTKHFAYAPDPLTVSAGTRVVFTNSDETAHTVTANDSSFDSHDMPQGATWSHVFARAGTYRYFCAYHRYMTGTVVVR